VEKVNGEEEHFEEYYDSSDRVVYLARKLSDMKSKVSCILVINTQ
jgi:hypothetical protein